MEPLSPPLCRATICKLALVVVIGCCLSAAAAEPPITAAAFTPDGSRIVVGSQSGIAIHSWPQLELVGKLDTRLASVHDLAFSAGGDRLAAVGGDPATSGAIELFSWPRGERTQHHSLGDDVVYQASWQPGDASLALAGPDHGIRLVTPAGRIDRQIAGHSQDVTTVAFLPGGYFVSGSRDQTIRVWQHGSELVRTLNNHTQALHDIAPKPGLTDVPFVIASASADRTVRFWWPVRGRLMRFAKLPSPALDIDWLPDGSAIIAGCADGHLRVIDPDTVEVTCDIAAIDAWLYTVAAAPDGQSAFAGGAGGTMRRIELP